MLCGQWKGNNIHFPNWLFKSNPEGDFSLYEYVGKYSEDEDKG